MYDPGCRCHPDSVLTSKESVQLRTASRGRVAALDGLRGCAALAVVAAHLAVNLGLAPYTPGAVCGVLVFFVLSGYLIARIVWTRPGSFHSYGEFLAKRARRLLPALSALCLLGLPLMVFAGGEPIRNAVLNVALAASQATAFAWAAGAPVHQAWSPTWSLSVEWTFYVLAPLVLILLRRRGYDSRSASMGICVVALFLYAAGLCVPPRAFYLLPLANLAIMFMGASLALMHLHEGQADRRGVSSGTPVLAGLLLVIIAVLPAYTLALSYRLLTLPAVTFCTLLVIHQVHSGGPLVRILSARVLRGVGLRAYSLYLWHLPVLWIAWVRLADQGPLIVSAAGLLALVPVVEISYQLLERPRMGSELRPAPSRQPLRTQSTPQGPLEHAESTQAC
jgi:peptidoglycan/LPS O-acetylase OafA/YrhL